MRGAGRFAACRGLRFCRFSCYVNCMPKTEAAATAELIADYDARVARRWTNCQLGSARAATRQGKIDALVAEISRRADDGDAVALAWYEL